MEQPVVSGIAFNRDEAKLTISGVPDIPGSALRISEAGQRCQYRSGHDRPELSATIKTDFTFTVHRNDYERAKAVLEKVAG